MAEPSLEVYIPALRSFHFSAGAAQDGTRLLQQPAAELFHAILTGKESEGVLFAAKSVVDAVLAGALGAPSAPPPQGDLFEALSGQLALLREAARHTCARTLGDPGLRASALRERAAVSLAGTCWLERVSQPATQPAGDVNLLFARYFEDLGAGNPERARAVRSRRVLERHGVFLPEIGARDFAALAQADPATLALASFYLSLGAFTASYLPEVIGIDWVVRALGVDRLLAGDEAADADAGAVARRYLEALSARSDASPQSLQARLVYSVRLGSALETRHLDRIAHKATALHAASLDDKVGEIVRRHYRHAGAHHARIKVGGRTLVERFAAAPLDTRAFVGDLKRSAYLRSRPGEECRFLRALRFGGPMFGVFNEEEAAILRRWAADAGADATPSPAAAPGREDQGAPCFARPPRDLVLENALPDPGPRELFHRLVNIENYPCVLPAARRIVENGLESAKRMLDGGRATKYTDASSFEYSRAALEERAERIYWEKLLAPYRPLPEVPPRDAVVFQQKTYALGNLIDGSWLYRAGHAGCADRRAEAALFSIYADEMGRGEMKKNHIALIHRVLRSMGLQLPHIRDERFKEQDELPDELYPFALFQLSLAQFPASFRPEIIGYNLAIEMFGLGELRLHEIQKLRHWGFDAAYEETHLSIDNIASGHSRTSIDAVHWHLEQVQKQCGGDQMRREWRRLWLGYAAFAQFVEPAAAAPLEDFADHVV